MKKTKKVEKKFFQLHSGGIYRDKTYGDRIVLKWINCYDDGSLWAIVHPEGEPSMQDCYSTSLSNIEPSDKKYWI